MKSDPFFLLFRVKFGNKSKKDDIRRFNELTEEGTEGRSKYVSIKGSESETGLGDSEGLST